MSNELIYLLIAAVLTGCLTAWVWCFVNKWEVSEDCTISQWVQIHAPKKIGEMMRCPFCFNFWLSLLFSIVLAVTMKEWYFVFVPLFSTTIGRWLSA
ncbi:MAG: hypothetical protein J6R31_00070 [Rikenellaceae bacterium]|nr:hypothetical protein [Rikenellaceae bacterium]